MTPPPNTCGYMNLTCGDGSCLPGNLRCDGVKDCNGGEDEVGCGKTCPPGSRYCLDSNECIMTAAICDGQANCKDGSDEAMCSRKLLYRF